MKFVEFILTKNTTNIKLMVLLTTMDELINILLKCFYEFSLILYFDIQTNLYIKVTDGNLKMWP